LIRRLAHWLMPACAASGSRGLPVPDPVEITTVIRPGRRNSALAAPADFAARPDVVTRAHAVPAEELYGALLRVAAGRERTFLAAAYPTRLQAHFVVRSEKLNAPGVIVAEAMPLGDDASVAVIYAASVYGWFDFSVNRRLVAAWVAALDAMAVSRGLAEEQG
jgi:hypothetical protein